MAKKVRKIIKKENRFLKCILTHEELFEAGKTQADKHGELTRVEADAKRVASDFKARIDALKAELGCLAGKITAGYEHRDVVCRVEYDEPEIGKKRIIREDTFELVGIENMTGSEMQRDFVEEGETKSGPLTD